MWLWLIREGVPEFRCSCWIVDAMCFRTFIIFHESHLEQNSSNRAHFILIYYIFLFFVQLDFFRNKRIKGMSKINFFSSGYSAINYNKNSIKSGSHTLPKNNFNSVGLPINRAPQFPKHKDQSTDGLHKTCKGFSGTLYVRKRKNCHTEMMN